MKWRPLFVAMTLALRYGKFPRRAFRNSIAEVAAD